MRNVVFGVNAIYEALRMRPRDIIQIVIAKERTLQNVNQILVLSKRNQIPVVQKDRDEFKKWIRMRVGGRGDHLSHQGIVAEIKSQSFLSLEEVLNRREKTSASGFLLICDEITDPHNLGAMIRTAACAKANAVIMSKRGGALITPVVIKVSSGGIEHVPVCQVANMSQTLNQLKEAGFFIIGLDAQASTSLYDVNLEGLNALVVGNEERGLKRGVRDHCDQLVKIPMRGDMDSLNVSVAAGIAMFEIVRVGLLRNQKSKGESMPT